MELCFGIFSLLSLVKGGLGIGVLGFGLLVLNSSLFLSEGGRELTEGAR